MPHERRRLGLSPEVQAFHEKVEAALAAFKAAPPEEKLKRRQELEALTAEGAAQIRRTQAAVLALLDTFEV
jgi:hypothetical protein